MITLLPWKQKHIWCLQNSNETERRGTKAAIPGVHSCIIPMLLLHLRAMSRVRSGPGWWLGERGKYKEDFSSFVFPIVAEPLSFVLRSLHGVHGSHYSMFLMIMLKRWLKSTGLNYHDFDLWWKSPCVKKTNRLSTIYWILWWIMLWPVEMMQLRSLISVWNVIISRLSTSKTDQTRSQNPVVVRWVLKNCKIKKKKPNVKDMCVVSYYFFSFMWQD